ncbi:hypothetical protein HDU96_008290 [Phlyctochytrium bullatum]|nr:hypothetical protein HDU96_008290 [Phlyctochytrium bullatum]
MRLPSALLAAAIGAWALWSFARTPSGAIASRCSDWDWRSSLSGFIGHAKCLAETTLHSSLLADPSGLQVWSSSPFERSPIAGPLKETESGPAGGNGTWTDPIASFIVSSPTVVSVLWLEALAGWTLVSLVESHRLGAPEIIRWHSLITIGAICVGYAPILAVWFGIMAFALAPPRDFNHRSISYRRILGLRFDRLGSLRPSTVKAATFVSLTLYSSGILSVAFARGWLPNLLAMNPLFMGRIGQGLGVKALADGCFMCVMMLLAFPSMAASASDVLVLSHLPEASRQLSSPSSSPPEANGHAPDAKGKTTSTASKSDKVPPTTMPPKPVFPIRPVGSEEAIFSFRILSWVFTICHIIFLLILLSPSLSSLQLPAPLSDSTASAPPPRPSRPSPTRIPAYIAGSGSASDDQVAFEASSLLWIELRSLVLMFTVLVVTDAADGTLFDGFVHAATFLISAVVKGPGAAMLDVWRAREEHLVHEYLVHHHFLERKA